MKIAAAVCFFALASANDVEAPKELLDQWSSFSASDDFYDGFETAMLETGAMDAPGGDFEFKCETTCQLVKKAAAAAGGMGPMIENNAAAAGGMGPAMGAPPAQAQQEGGSQTKECYRLCLNPKLNPGCSVAISTGAASFTETSSKPGDGTDWALDQDANCLANCVRVCVNVHNMVQLQMQQGTYKY